MRRGRRGDCVKGRLYSEIIQEGFKRVTEKEDCEKDAREPDQHEEPKALVGFGAGKGAIRGRRDSHLF